MRNPDALITSDRQGREMRVGYCLKHQQVRATASKQLLVKHFDEMVGTASHRVA
jgi:predicted transcriptional regulator